VSGDNLLRFDNGKNISQSQNLKILSYLCNAIFFSLLHALFYTLFNSLLAITSAITGRYDTSQRQFILFHKIYTFLKIYNEFAASHKP
jgi:hypothetical protein